MTEIPEEVRYRKDKKGFATPQDVWLDKYKYDFENYLNYNQKYFGKKYLSKDNYKSYSLGAWIKVNNL